MATIIIQEDPKWVLNKVHGKFVATTKEESERLWYLQRRYDGFENVPEVEEFEAFQYEQADGGWMECTGKSLGKFKIKDLEFFVVPIMRKK